MAEAAPSQNYALVAVDNRICSYLSSTKRTSLKRHFGTGTRPAKVPVGVGDELQLMIWEAGAAGGLFRGGMTNAKDVGGGSTAAAIPPQVVDENGTIAIPFVGRLSVVGLTASEIEQQVIKALEGKAVDPQVIVRTAKTVTHSITLAGDAVAGGQVQLDVSGGRILSVIAASGGLRVPAYEAVVQLNRHGRLVSKLYTEILENPEENIFLEGGDVLSVRHDPKTFTALGALGANGVLAFGSDNLALDEAIGKIGGLIDRRANPAAVFVFRHEQAALVQEIAPDRVRAKPEESVPVIYLVDLSEPASYFCARQFAMHDKDIVYVANAPLNDLQKFLNIIGSTLSPIATGSRL